MSSDDPFSAIDDAALVAYFMGDCDAASCALVERWASEFPSEFEDARTVWGVTAGPQYAARTDEFVEHLQARIAQTAPQHSPQELRAVAPKQGRSTYNQFLKRGTFGAYLPAKMTRFVLSVCAIVAIAFGWWSSRPDGAQPLMRYATGTGERAQVTLPDGSRITIAPESRLSYTVDAHGARTVTLVGQAYFRVMHDARHPFTVHTGSIQTQVLGTAFDVRHYGDDAVVRIRVADGKVASRGRGGRSTPVLLAAGDEGQLTDSTALIMTNRKAEYADAWTRGLLVFDETTVSDMLRTLQHWYGYEFRLTDSTIARKQVTTTFAIGDTVNTMADLKQLLDVTLRFDGSIVTMSPAHRRKTADRPKYQRWSPVFPSQSEVGK